MAGNKTEEDSENTPQTTVPDAELMIKHPLHNCWTLWLYEIDRKKKWIDGLKEIASFDSVEDFWSIYNHIKTPNELKIGSDYFIFKKGIQPMWEDTANLHGGRWIVNVEKRHNETESGWLEVMLLLIGEGFGENSDEVCGASCSVRLKADKISVWTAYSDKSKENSIVAIGKKIKERLQLTGNQALLFQTHKDWASKTGSTSKIMYTL